MMLARFNVFYIQCEEENTIAHNWNTGQSCANSDTFLEKNND